MTEFNITTENIIDSSWLKTTTISAGPVPKSVKKPDLYILIEKSDVPFLRVDLYQDDDHSGCFQEAIIWNSLVVIGYGNHLYFISIDDRTLRSLKLNDYFGHLYPNDDFLLAASGCDLTKFDSGANLVWVSDQLGIDGVLVNDILDGLIMGIGEWNPPGGWQPFQISLTTGQLVE